MASTIQWRQDLNLLQCTLWGFQLMLQLVPAIMCAVLLKAGWGARERKAYYLITPQSGSDHVISLRCWVFREGEMSKVVREDLGRCDEILYRL